MTTVDKGLQSLAEDSRRAFLERTVRELFELRAKGDAEGVRRRFAPDCVYNELGAWTKGPYLVRPGGRTELMEALRLINVDYEDLGSQIHEFLIDGDRVALHRTAWIRNRGTGGTMTLDMWQHFRFRDGLVAEYAVYLDVASLMALQMAAAED